MTRDPIKTLIVGGDSTIGRALAGRLATAGGKVVATTRRHDGPDDGRIHLDLATEKNKWPRMPSADVWVLCAGVTNIADCRRDPGLSRKVNVEAMVDMAGMAISAGAHVVFLSTNQVFDGTVPHRPADDPVCPKSVYGRHKADAEQAILALGDKASVVRLTKVLAPDAKLLPVWIAALRRGGAIHPFSDMVLAPVSLETVVAALCAIMTRRLTGIFQVSGPRDVSYAAVARHLARRLAVSDAYVSPTTALESGALPEELPAHTTLDTTRLATELGLHPADPLDLVDDLYGLRKS